MVDVPQVSPGWGYGWGGQDLEALDYNFRVSSQLSWPGRVALRGSCDHQIQKPLRGPAGVPRETSVLTLGSFWPPQGSRPCFQTEKERLGGGWGGSQELSM